METHPNTVFDPSEVKKRWAVLPTSMIVIEFFGNGDPYFGGHADDRPLGLDGLILNRPIDRAKVASFKTVEQAHQAAMSIPNRRENSTIGVCPTWS